MTERRGGGQRKIPVSEMRGVEYKKRPQSGEAEKKKARTSGMLGMGKMERRQ